MVWTCLHTWSGAVQHTRVHVAHSHSHSHSHGHSNGHSNSNSNSRSLRRVQGKVWTRHSRQRIMRQRDSSWNPKGRG